MNILAALLIIPFLSACSSNLKNKHTPLSFHVVNNFTPGLTTESDVIAKLGNPTDTKKSDNSFSLTFADENSLERAFLTFKSSDRLLQSVIWVPFSEDKEISLQNVKANFKNAHYRKIKEPNKISHLIINRASLINDLDGVTISYNEDSEKVEAIGKFIPNARFPTSK